MSRRIHNIVTDPSGIVPQETFIRITKFILTILWTIPSVIVPLFVSVTFIVNHGSSIWKAMRINPFAVFSARVLPTNNSLRKIRSL